MQIDSTSVVTVIGGAGFVGRYVVERLARTGCQIRIGTRRPDRALFLKTSGDIGLITPLAVNIRDPQSVTAIIQGADVVINLVGILAEHGRQRFQAVQAEGAAQIARAAAAGVKRLVHVSAIGADAQSPAAYARSKAAGEQAMRAAFPSATILRPSIIFGAEDGFFNRFAAMAEISPVIPLVGAATKFQPVYVGDVAGAIVNALQRDSAQGETYELGGPRVYSFRALIELMLRVIDRRRCIIGLPFPLASLQASLLQLLPSAPLTLDQVRMLRRDNIADPRIKGLADLDIIPQAVETIIPTYLQRYRPQHGRPF